MTKRTHVPRRFNFVPSQLYCCLLCQLCRMIFCKEDIWGRGWMIFYDIWIFDDLMIFDDSEMQDDIL